MAKPVVKFRTYKQADRVGGKIYGVANLADPVVAEVTMQEVIDYAKLHNYSSDTLAALLSQVISGVAALVARDGRPRNLSDLLKFEPTIKGTFASLEAGITNQKIVVRPRMLKEIKVNIPADSYAWRNQNDTLQPRIISVAPKSAIYSEVNLDSVRAGIAAATGFGWTLAGNRLAPQGWDESCKFEVVLSQQGVDYHLEFAADVTNDLGETVTSGYITRSDGDEATDNAIALGFNTAQADNQAWFILSGGIKRVYEGELIPLPGDVIRFRFTRTVGSGDTFTVEKAFTL